MMTLRKAMALSVGLLFVGFVGALTVFLGKAVWSSYMGGAWIVARFIEDDFRRALDWGIVAVLPGLFAITLSGCWYLVERFNDPT